MTTSTSPPVPGLTWGALLLAALSGMGWVYTEYTHNDREIAQRISKLEQHNTDIDPRLDRMEKKLDKLVEWALGKPPKSDK